MPVADRPELDWRCVAAGTGGVRSPDPTFALVTPFHGDEALRGTEVRLASTPWWAQWTASGPEQSLRGPGPITLVVPDVIAQTSVDDLMIDLRREGATIFISVKAPKAETLSSASKQPSLYMDPLHPGWRLPAVREPPVIERDEPMPQPAASVRDLASRAKDASQLTDEQLAAVFPGELARETFQRWRTLSAGRPTQGNLRRLGLLHQLFEDLAARVAEPRNWLLQFGPSLDGKKPYDLLLAGRFSEVQNLVASLPALAAVDGGGQVLEPDLGPIPHDHTPDQVDFTAFADDEGDWVDVEDDGEDAPG